jgi:hypothetical protein
VRELYRCPYIVLTLDEDRMLLRRARTDKAFPSIEDAGAAYDAMLAAIDHHIDRSDHVQLVDMRLAPPRNDRAFEEFVGRYTVRLYGGFRRTAAVVKTQAGRLQLARVFAAFDFEVPAFTEEASALAYLMAAPPRPRDGRARRGPAGPAA